MLSADSAVRALPYTGNLRRAYVRLFLSESVIDVPLIMLL